MTFMPAINTHTEPAPGNPPAETLNTSASVVVTSGPIEPVDIRDLSDHPLLVGIPTWDAESAEFQALKESIRERGLDYPLLVDTEFRIVDGRNRRNALRALGRKAPVRFVSPTDAASIIVASLVNRRHLTKGALAYVCAPLFDKVLAESSRRRIANLRNVDPALSAVSTPTTAQEIAASLGIGLRLFEQAIALHSLFTELGEEVRQKYEPRLLGPWQDEAGEMHDAVGLGYMINGLTSLADQAQGKDKDLGKRAQHDRLFVSALPKLSLHWDKANPEQRRSIAEQLKKAVTQFPAELRDELAAALKAAARANHA